MRKAAIYLSTVVLCFASGDLMGTTVRPLNLQQITSGAKTVFYGTCLKAEPVEDSGRGLPVVEYTFQVKQAVKGVSEGETFVFRQVRSGDDGLGGIQGIPSYRPGEQYMLFLHGKSARGQTSPVGLQQGSFKVVKTPGGRLGLMNLLNNRNLTYGLSDAAATDSGLTAQEYQMLKRQGAIPLDSFTTIVNRMMRLNNTDPNRNR